MSTSHRRFKVLIKGSLETIFDLLADLPNYGRWLPGSQAFGATTQVEPYPVVLGTTYLDAGPAGQRPGSVTGYDPPTHLAFHQTMLVKRGPLTADIDVNIRYYLENEGNLAQVSRDLDLVIKIPGPLKVANFIVARAFYKENKRVLDELKRYVENQAP